MRIRSVVDYNVPPNHVKDAIQAGPTSAVKFCRDAQSTKGVPVDLADHARSDYEIKDSMGNHSRIQ